MPRIRGARPAALALVLVAAGACFTTRFELDQWHEVRTDHFSVITNVTEERALDLARSLEFFRAVALRSVQLRDVEDRVPTRFYLFRGQESYRPFQLDRGVVGYFMQPLDGNVLVANLDPVGLRPADVLLHEFTHLLLRNQDATVPIWFDEGFAEFLSTMNLTENQVVEFGRPPRRRMQDLRDMASRGGWLPLAQILKVRSLAEVEPEQKPIFYAQSWLAVHFLYLGHLMAPDAPDHSESLHRYLALLDEGRPPEEAWTTAFGVEPEVIDAQMRAYYANPELPYLTYSYDEFPWSEKAEARVVGRPEILTRLGELLLAVGRPNQAGHFLRRAVALRGDSARALAGLARTVTNPARQQELFDRAVAADPDDGVVYGWRASELADSIDGGAADLDAESEAGAGPIGPDAVDPSVMEEAQRLADLCVQLRPDLPLGHVLQGRLLRIAYRDPNRAIPALERAHALLPSHPRTTLWLGELYADAGRREQALRLLRKVQQLAHFDTLSAEATRRIEALEQGGATAAHLDRNMCGEDCLPPEPPQ